MPSIWSISLEDFRRWNPSISATCTGFEVGKSYCVEVTGEPAPVSSTFIKSPTPTPTPTPTPAKSSSIIYSSSKPTVITSSTLFRSTSKSSSIASSTTSAGNGVQTPQPTQAGMVANCAKFYFVADGTSCSTVLSANGISIQDLYKWNPSVNSDCTGMWGGVNVCVGVLGGSTSVKPSSTVPSNGVQTPQPTQPGMVTNCNKFYFIDQGVICDTVTSKNGISLSNFIKWNPSVGSDCTGMQAGVNVCVGVIGGTTPTPTPTTPNNGITTPQPTQPGMVTNCNKFHWISEGNVCSQILSYNKISLADFYKWNPSIKSDCTSMQANVNVCVGVIGGSTPTPTTSAGNGVQTPQPTQPGLVSYCKKFHYVDTGVTCDRILSYNRISLSDFYKWNQGVGSDCRSMWAKTYHCVGV
ncbi:hypothetical protein GQ44DRAFT_720227 [Phaeosphaeriaceae sp. PMI808]|nr:hypothetical protein GQ44DRAFT_720227 [Phaeosphaeriaceae sp. PMI808]